MIPLIETNGLQTNFGPNFWAAVHKLNSTFDGCWLPVTTGTAAIQLACQVRFRRGDRIAVPDFTMVATLHAVVAAGCEPVIVGCEEHSGVVSYSLLQALVAEKAIDGAVIVSPFGAKIDPLPFDSLGVPVVYDLAGAWPAQLVTRNPVAYSCHATKNISTREGGLVCFSSELLWEKARRLSAFDLDHNRFPCSLYANNFKMDEARCAMLLSQIESKDVAARIERKRQLVEAYAEALPWAVPLANLSQGCPSLCVFIVPDAEELETAGNKAGITFKRYYHPLMSDAFPDLPRRCQDSQKLRNSIAFPSDVNEHEFRAVVNFAKGFGDLRSWRPC